MTIVEIVDYFNGFSVFQKIINFKTKKAILWVFSGLAFILSAIIDNLTATIVLISILQKVVSDKKLRIWYAALIVVAANAGGAFSPFGDITSLMVWQAGKVEFFTFFQLVVPSIVNYIIPAVVMSFFVEDDQPSLNVENTEIKYGGKIMILLGILTIITAVSFHNFFHLPPVLGMMTGLSYLLIYGYFIKQYDSTSTEKYDVLQNIAHIEWDTLLFFFGVIIAVSGLGMIGYLEMASDCLLYTSPSPRDS